MKTKNWGYLFVAAILLVISGCAGDETTIIQSSEATGIVTGKVVDSATLQPIANADVVLLANGEKFSTKSSASTDPDLAGTFVFRGLSATDPYSAGHTLKILASGYALVEKRFQISQSSDNTPVTNALGDIPLGKGFDLSVLVSDFGTPVPGVTVMASSYYGTTSPKIIAVTDSNGVALLQGLNQETSYVISSAPVYDGLGALEYVSSSAGTYTYQSAASTVLSLPLVRANGNDAIEIVASNFLGEDNNYYSSLSMTPDQEVKIVFNYPVTLSEAVSATYVNDQVPDTDATYGAVLTVPTVSGTLDSTGTILTITNSAAYLKNQEYFFGGAVSGQSQTFSLSSLLNDHFSTDRAYVADNTATGLDSLTALKADNFNGTTGLTATTNPAGVYALFPERISGSFRVISTTTGTTTTPANDYLQSIGFQSGSVLYASNAGGADNAVVYAVPLYIYLADNGAAEVNEVTILFDVEDIEGNLFSKMVTLPIQ